MRASRTTPTRRCGNCGARVTPDDPRACVFCGAELPISANPVLSKAQRFELLRRHPACPRLLERKPSTAGLMRVNGLVFFLLCATAVVTGVTGVSSAAAGEPNPFFHFAVATAAVAILVCLMRRAAQRARDDLRAVPALVVRTQERGVTYKSDGGLILAAIDPAIWATASVVDAARDTSSRATIETYDGKRLDLELVEAIERTVEPGDLGIAYVAAGYLVDFARVEG